nr:hypothetical protein BaRGS_001282 [Batillaria attramentaria]
MARDERRGLDSKNFWSFLPISGVHTLGLIPRLIIQQTETIDITESHGLTSSIRNTLSAAGNHALDRDSRTFRDIQGLARAQRVCSDAGQKSL